jgi:hypothetical protein
MNFPGNCLYNHKEEKMWLDIPKNASKSISHHLLKMGWKNGNYIEDKKHHYEAVIVVRDVISRWKGSTIEVCYHHIHHAKYDFLNFETWFTNKNWKSFDRIGDLHHQPLSYFCRDLIKPRYIAMDSRFSRNVKDILAIEDLRTINSTIENEHKVKIETYVNELLLDDVFINKLLQYYAEDQTIFLAASNIYK